MPLSASTNLTNAHKQSADVIITGARVHTMVAESTAPHERAIAIAGDRIIAVGDTDEVMSAFGSRSTRIDNFAGQTITPGLIDAHLHPIQGVELTQGIDLAGITDMRTLRERLAEEARSVRSGHGNGWVRGWNLDYAAFEGRALEAAVIDDVLGDMPAILFFFDFHTAVANSEALRRANITGPMPFADSAEIVCNSQGEPTGELREESSYQPVIDVMPAPTRDETLDIARETFRRMRQSGLTGGTIMDGGLDTFGLLSDLDKSGDGLPVRIVSAMDIRPSHSADDREEVFANLNQSGARWRGGLVKLYADGVIETGSGWLYEADCEGGGLEGFWTNQADFSAVVKECTAAGFQVATHAIGDRAVGETVLAYIAAGCGASGRAKHRIEHAETLDPRDVQRIADSGIHASLQIPHMQWRLADGSDEWSRRLGPLRTSRAWNAGSLVRAGAPLALGSDWPIADLDARVGLAWSVLRRTPGDRDGFVFEPEECLTGYQALHGYTRGAALAQGDDDLGVIREGALADLAVWDDDPTEVPGDELISLPVPATYLGGVREDNA
jgi:predicted amidohydrolase YtcJ